MLTLHEENQAGLLKADLKTLKKDTRDVAQEVIFGEEGLGTMEKNFQDSVVFAKGKVQADLEALVHRNSSAELKQRRNLLFARTISDSAAVEAEDEGGQEEDESLLHRLRTLEEQPAAEQTVTSAGRGEKRRQRQS